MEIKGLNELIKSNFEKLTENVDQLFEVNVDKDELWNLYLDSFPVGTNEIFRERREYDCSNCRQFVKNMGNVVVIKDNKVITIWDLETGSAKFQPVVDALAKHVKSFAVSDVWVNKFGAIGTAKNFETTNEGVLTWEHLNLKLPKKFVVSSSKSEAELMGSYRDVRNVFKRSLDELTEESVLMVLELISQNSLYKGEEWKAVLQQFLKYKQEYEKLESEELKANYAWEKSVKAGGSVGKIRNHSMGTLLVDISKGMDLDAAVRSFESKVAGPNYKRVKPVYSERQLKEADDYFEKEGYKPSLPRRHATLDDISVNNILFCNRDSAKRIEGGDIFGEMRSAIPVNPKQFSKVEEISINDFLNSILPTVTEIELFLENKQADNMVSLIAPQNKDSKNMFKWDNPFSWAYAGNITDSNIKGNVKSAGGNVDGVLRFSIQWNDEHPDKNDLDAHCKEPGGYEIYFRNKRQLSPTGGMLDVDIINPENGKAAVENITWANTSRMKEGVYRFFVHNYSHNGGRTGFKAEIEIDGQTYSFEYNKELREDEEVTVAEVHYSKANGFTIVEKLPSNVSSREVWGLQTNQFVPVSVVMFSPNYWDEQQGIGHKHFFFMLKDCVNPESPNGFYNEFLKEEFTQFKRVTEAIGAKVAVQVVEDQLSGLGFSSTKRNEVLVKVKGNTERVLKIKF